MCSSKWLMVMLVACGLTSACSSYNTNLSIQTSSSVLTFISPSSAHAGDPGFTITANGQGFTTGAQILWNGTALTTTLVSSIQLTATVPASDLATAGTVNVAIKIPGSATSGTNINSTTTTEVSNDVPFTIQPPAGTPPAITSLSASTTSAASTPYCSSQGFALTVNGTNFTSDAKVNWNGVLQPTTFVSATQLTASIAPTEAAFPGTAGVTVSNSIGTSNSFAFALSTPATALPDPGVSSVSPGTAAAGGPTLTITVQGSNILPCTVVQWTGPNNVTNTLATTYVPAAPQTSTSPGNPIELTATVPAADFVISGTASQSAKVTAFNIAPCVPTQTKMCPSLQFMIEPPSITSVSASTTSMAMTGACSPSGVTLTVNGANFVNGSVVEWATNPPPAIPSPLATTFVSSTQLTATVPSTYIASATTVNIEVSNFGVLSNTKPFTISALSLPVPTLSSISPVSATAGTVGFTLRVTGTNFLPCSVVQWMGSGRATSYVSATQLQAEIPVTDIHSVGMVPVTVFNPGPAGGTSNAISFSIAAPTITSLSASTTSMASTPYCSASGLTLTVNGTNFVDGLVVNWNGSPRQTTFMSDKQLTAEITPADTAFAGTVAITVSSSTTSSNSLNFSMTTPATNLATPAIASLQPSSAPVVTAPVSGALAFTLTVNGSDLLPCSTVQWNGSPRPTLFVATTGIQASIFQQDISAIRTDQVTVSTPPPPPGGGLSNASTFTVFMPVAAAARISAAPQLAGSFHGTTTTALALPLESADKRYSVFLLGSTDGATEIPGAAQNVFLRDTCAGATAGCVPSVTLVSVGLNGNPADGNSTAPSISADGRYVAFLSSAMNLVDSDTNGVTDVFVRDTCAGATSACTPSTQRASISSGGTQANGATTSAAIDATGRYVTFVSAATNLAAPSSTGGIFLRDTCAGASSACTPSTQQLQ